MISYRYRRIASVYRGVRRLIMVPYWCTGRTITITNNRIPLTGVRFYKFKRQREFENY